MLLYQLAVITGFADCLGAELMVVAGTWCCISRFLGLSEGGVVGVHAHS